MSRAYSSQLTACNERDRCRLQFTLCTAPSYRIGNVQESKLKRLFYVRVTFVSICFTFSRYIPYRFNIKFHSFNVPRVILLFFFFFFFWNIYGKKIKRSFAHNENTIRIYCRCACAKHFLLAEYFHLCVVVSFALCLCSSFRAFCHRTNVIRKISICSVKRHGRKQKNVPFLLLCRQYVFFFLLFNYFKAMRKLKLQLLFHCDRNLYGHWF